MQIDYDELINVLKQVTGHQSLEYLDLGKSTVKFFEPSRNALYRIFHPTRSDYIKRFHQELNALKFLRKFDTPLEFPKILDQGDLGENGFYLAVSWLLGEHQPLSSIDKYTIWQRFSQNSLALAEETQSANLPDHLTILKEYISTIPSEHLSTNQQEYLTKFSRSMQRCQHSSLIHGDFHPYNILNKTKIIDWEFAAVGCVYFDLAYLCSYDVLPKLHSAIEVIEYYQHEFQLLDKYSREHVVEWLPFVFVVMATWFLLRYTNSKKPSDLKHGKAYLTYLVNNNNLFNFPDDNLD